ncbi:hypothetical protein D3C72_2371080 [compost metagenome]
MASSALRPKLEARGKAWRTSCMAMGSRSGMASSSKAGNVGVMPSWYQRTPHKGRISPVSGSTSMRGLFRSTSMGG